MKKVLFIDRDGTIVKEPPIDFQLDSYEKLEFLHGAIRNLYKIQKELDYTFVMVTNQDGLGTDSFPADTFWPVHNKMLSILKSEEGATIVKNKTERKKKINFLKNSIEETNV